MTYDSFRPALHPPGTRLAAALTGLFVLVLALIGPRPALAQEFLANQIEGFLSSETLQVEIEGLSGALTGDIRIEQLTASDPEGVFLTASDLALDWSPLALVRSNVSIENLTAGQIVLERLPTGQPPAAEESQGGGFSLPSITADVDNFAIEELIIGEALAGVRARLRVNASLALSSDPTNLSVQANIERLDQPGQIAIDLAFAPDENQLTVDVQASEPPGGLVANLLDIPDRPAVELTIKGSGPLSDFMANGALTVGGEQAATLTARVNDVDNGRRVAASLSVAAERFVPQEFEAYVGGGTNLDVDVLIADDGTYVIDQGQLASDALALRATGTLDLEGSANDLAISLQSRDGTPIPFSLGEPPSQTSLQIASFGGTLSGALANATLSVEARLPQAGFGEYQAENVTATVTSDAFSVTELRGPLSIVATTDTVAAPEGIQERLLTGPVRIAVDGALTENGLVFQPSTATTETATLNLQGSAALDFAIFDLTVDSSFQTSALSAALVPIAGEVISIDGAVQRTPDGTITLQNLEVSSPGLSIEGQARIGDQGISADISGRLSEANTVNAALAGAAEFQLHAEGPLDQPNVTLSVDGNGLSINGRELADLEVRARGTLNPAAPTGVVEITGTLDGTPLEGRANLETLDSGERIVSDLLIRQGSNRVTGELRLTEAFVPIGSIDLTIEDLGPLAALGGVEAAGDVRGTIVLDQQPDGTPVASPDISSNSLTIAGTTLQGAEIDVDVADYLGIPFATGSVTANAIQAGGVTVSDLDINLDRQGEFNGLQAEAQVNGVPVDLAGLARFAPDETVISLQRLSAEIQEAPISLEDNATVRIADGVTTLDGFILAVGEGRLRVAGSAGETLDLSLDIDALPVAVTSPFVAGVEPQGTISGTARVQGAAADPAATFELSGEGLATRQLIAADVPSISFTANGSYADGTLDLEQASADLGGGSLTASGRVGEELDVEATLTEVPVALADGFVTGLDAKGTISGTARVTGTPGDPNAMFTLTGSDITTGEIAASGIAPLTLDVAGAYADETLTVQQARIDVGDGSLEASGSIGEELDIDLRVQDFPVGLANGFVDDLDATGTISGTASATGSLTEPSATFDFSGTGITARQIAEAGIEPVTLDVEGSYADGTAVISTANIDVGAGSLTASGTVGQDLDVDVSVEDLPVGLANGFVPDLNATGTISGTATATGSINDPTVQFDLSGSGITTQQIAQSGVAPIDLRLAGSFVDGTAQLETAVANVGDGSLTATGTIGENLDLDLTLNSLPVGLANGFVENLGAEGTLSGQASASGTLNDPSATFEIIGRDITTTQIAQSGIPPLSLMVAGTYDDETLTLRTARLEVGTGGLTATGTVGETLDLSLTVDQLPVGLANGFVDGLGATGTISGGGTATGSLSDPQAEFQLSGTGITTTQIAQSGIEPLTLEVSGSYADQTARIDNADITVGDGSLSASGTVGETIDFQLVLNDLPVGLANGFVDGLGASGTISGTASATGSLSDPQARFELSGSGITTTQIAQSGVAPISLTASGSYADGTLDLAEADIDVGPGSITASGTVGQTLNIDVAVDAIPVGIANGFVDGLGAQGTVSGTASARGSLANPDVSFDISADDVSVAQSRAAGAPPLDASARGTYRGETLNLAAAEVTMGGGSITASGTVSPSALNVTAEINDLPASIASAAAGSIAPQGTINGTIVATGSPSNPSVTYDLRATGVSVQQTREQGIGTFTIDTNGQFANNVVTTTTSVSGDGIDLTASGSVNIAGTPTLNISVEGSAPLALANRTLATGGRSIEGTVTVDASLTGPATQPAVNGTVRIADARFVDTGFNVAVEDINATIALNGQTATITAFSAQLASGGSLSVAGTVGLQPPFPADISIRLVDGRYNDGEIISASLDADLTITGPLTGTPLLAGTINADEINVIVPENLPTSLARIDVTHVNARPAVYEQQREIDPAEARGADAGGGLELDLTFNAPNQVFVRGRGLDLELGGDLVITGSASSPNIVGGFELRRGRFVILGKRLDFDRGMLTFSGDFVPLLDLLASSDAGDVTVYIAVTGPADDPSFNFSSNPALPQDEVLARLIFGQGTSDLSPLQIAQLAEAAASLAGVGGSTSLLENLRSQLGVDDIDIRTTADGETAVGVGKYLNDNTYLGVDSTGRVSIDLDLGSGLTARGAVNAEGGGEVGVFYEGEF